MHQVSNTFVPAHNNRGSSIAEMGPVLFILFVVILLPLIGLFSFIDGVAVLALGANVVARACAPATTRVLAKAQRDSVGSKIFKGGLAAFGGLTPQDLSPSLLSLDVLQITTPGGTTKTFDETTKVAEPIDTSKYVYLYQVTAKYGIKPLFYPGAPIQMSFKSTSAIEHAAGLNTGY